MEVQLLAGKSASAALVAIEQADSGDVCGDCNDAAAAVSPAAVEEPSTATPTSTPRSRRRTSPAGSERVVLK